MEELRQSRACALKWLAHEWCVAQHRHIPKPGSFRSEKAITILISLHPAADLSVVASVSDERRSIADSAGLSRSDFSAGTPIPPAASAHHVHQRRVPAPPCGPLLAFVPQLHPTDGWIHEVEHDGYRVQTIVDRGRARGFTRSGLDWTDCFGPVVDCAAGLRCTSAIIDGELVVQGERGLSDFHAVRAAIGARPEKLALFAFDLLHLNGTDLRLRPLEARRAALRESWARKTRRGTSSSATVTRAKALALHSSKRQTP